MRALAVCVVVGVLAGAPVPAQASADRARGCRPGGSADTTLPAWARQRRMTVFVDSVLLGAYDTFRRAMPCWRMNRLGRPALMVKIADAELRRSGTRVAPLVVVGLGYNTLWQRNRHRYWFWAQRFDRELASFVRVLRRRGARQIVWVTLREPTAATVPRHARAELKLYSWYFPWTNERLHRLDDLHADVSIANWTRASARPGLTYDTIHTTAAGSRLLASTIETAIRDEAVRQRRSG